MTMDAFLVFSTAAFVFGAVVGSFLNVCIARLPKGKSLGRKAYFKAYPYCVIEDIRGLIAVPNRSHDWFQQAVRDVEQAEDSRRAGRHEWVYVEEEGKPTTERRLGMVDFLKGLKTMRLFKRGG